MKQQLIDYIEAFNCLMSINTTDGELSTKAELFSGIRPVVSHKSSQIWRLDVSVPMLRKVQVDLAWVVEIWVNGACVIRKSRTNESESDLQQYELELVKETIQEIVMHGLNSLCNLDISTGNEEVACCGNCHLPLDNIEWVPRVRMADSDICDYSPYKNINNKEDYDKLLKSGMFWEFYPELSGIYDIDKEVIKQNNNGTRMD